MRIWAEPFIFLRFPKMFNPRTDPFERADVTSNTYWDWVIDHAFLSSGSGIVTRTVLALVLRASPKAATSNRAVLHDCPLALMLLVKCP